MRRAQAGSLTVNVVPRPTALSTSIVAAVKLHQLVHQSQADPGSLVRPAARAFDAVETIEHSRELLAGNAGTGVAHA